MHDSMWAFLLLLAGIPLACVALLYLRITAHEAAHAMVGGLLGLRVLGFVVGAGPVLVEFTVARCRFELHLWPKHGFVHVAAASPRLYRTRWIASLLAGPAADVACAWLLFMAARAVGGGTGLLMLFLAIAFAIVVLASLVPRTIRRLGIPNDVLHVWRTLRLRGDAARRAAEWNRVYIADHDAWHSLQRGDPAAALRIWDAVTAGAEVVGAVRSLCVWACSGAEAALQQVARDRQALLRVQDRAPLRQLELVLDVNEAFFLVLTGRGDALADAEARCRRALDREHGNVAAVRTLGLVQLHRGEVERGLRNLQWAWRQREPRWLRALCACYLAHGHALRGDGAAAGRFLAAARRLDPRCLLLPQHERRVAELMAAGATCAAVVARPAASERP
jgi:hypothetical protein